MPKKNMQEGKVVLEEAIQMAEEGRKVKGMGKRERYTQINAEFQRRSRREESLLK